MRDELTWFERGERCRVTIAIEGVDQRHLCSVNHLWLQQAVAGLVAQVDTLIAWLDEQEQRRVAAADRDY